MPRQPAAAQNDDSGLLSMAYEIAMKDHEAGTVEGSLYDHLLSVHQGLLERANQTTVARTPAKPAAAVSSGKKRLAPSKRPFCHPRDSVHQDYLVCLEDGSHHVMLARPLKRIYGLSKKDYIKRWNLPADYPFCAPSYSAKKMASAVQHGLGHHRKRDQQTSVGV